METLETLEARTERYLQEAERVRGAAERTEDPETRAVLLDVARQYQTAATMVRRQRWSSSCGTTDRQKRTPPSPVGLPRSAARPRSLPDALQPGE